MLEFDSVTFANGDFQLSADWALPERETLAIIGPSGSGKSTLLSGLAGFLPCISGQVIWNGVALPDAPDKRPVAMLFQAHNLFAHLTVAQNIGLGIYPALRLNSTDQSRISEALKAVGLPGMEARKPAELSGGQQSRAALARILVQAQPLILLDEPFAALGPALRNEMLTLVRDVAKSLSATLLMITHDPADARALDGLVSFVEAGQAQRPAPAAELFANPPQALRTYLG